MADGTRMKQMELQLQQVSATMMDVQTRVRSMEESLGSVIDQRLEEITDRLCKHMRIRATKSEKR